MLFRLATLQEVGFSFAIEDADLRVRRGRACLFALATLIDHAIRVLAFFLKLVNLDPIFLPFDFAYVSSCLFVWVLLADFVSVAPEDEEEEDGANDPSAHHEDSPEVAQEDGLRDVVSPFNADDADEGGHQHGQVSHQDYIDDRAPEEEALHVQAASFGQHVAHPLVTEVADEHDE